MDNTMDPVQRAIKALDHIIKIAKVWDGGGNEAIINVAEDAKKSILQIITMKESICTCASNEVVGKPKEETETNAKLIAPELLEALIALVSLGRKDTSNPKYDEYYRLAKETILKATE